MHIDKRIFFLVFLGLMVAMPSFGQRFTKKEQALREARAINYFYGNSFTLSSGFTHSWLSRDGFNEVLFGRTGQYSNTRESFDFAFAWDYCKKKNHGVQVSINYAQFGGEKLYYQDLGLGYGNQLRPDLTQSIHINELYLQGLYRYFFPLTYKSRLSANGGAYLGRVLGSYDDAKNWDMGLVVGVGYDWKQLSLSLNYLPGVYPNIISSSDARMGALMFNVGWHIWK